MPHGPRTQAAKARARANSPGGLRPAFGLRPATGGARPGFTLLELLVSAAVMVALTVIVAGMWRAFSVDLTDLAARARLAQELRLAVESLRSDMGSAVGAVPVGDSAVLLCRDGGNPPNGVADWDLPDNLVQYSAVSGHLVRLDRTTGVQITVADYVTEFAVQDVGGTALRMRVTVARAGVQRQVTLLWTRP